MERNGPVFCRKITAEDLSQHLEGLRNKLGRDAQKFAAEICDSMVFWFGDSEVSGAGIRGSVPMNEARQISWVLKELPRVSDKHSLRRGLKSSGPGQVIGAKLKVQNTSLELDAWGLYVMAMVDLEFV